jgi:hypothetical protein
MDIAHGLDIARDTVRTSGGAWDPDDNGPLRLGKRAAGRPRPFQWAEKVGKRLNFVITNHFISSLKIRLKSIFILLKGI